MNRLSILLVTGIVIMYAVSCKQPAVDQEGSDPLVARVLDYTLHQSDLDELLSPGLSSSDRQAISNAYIENWIRDQLWRKQAQKHIKSTSEINQLVDSYRSSLLKIAYENQVLEQELDSTITDAEYEMVYDQYKGQFVLDELILKGWFAKIPKSVSNQTDFFTSWKKNNKGEAIAFCQSSGAECMFFSEQTWVKRTELENFIPDKFVKTSEVKSLNNYRKSDKTYNYYLKYREFEDKNELPPFDFIKEELKRVVIHKRKQKIIADLTEKIYEKGIQSNQIQVFNNQNL